MLSFASEAFARTGHFDRLARRADKAITHSGDWDCTYRYYWDDWKMLEVRNGSDEVLKQNVWGLMYIDELVQVAINQR